MPSTATQVIERPNRQWKDETSNLVANFEDVARHVEEEASDSGSPIPAEYTALGGDDTLKGMTNFSAPELDALWALVEPAVTITWTQGRGRKPSVSGKDALFITLIVLKHYDTWQKHETDFNIGMSPLEKMVHRAIQTVEPCCTPSWSNVSSCRSRWKLLTHSPTIKMLSTRPTFHPPPDATQGGRVKS
ncbi:hypothetical protein PC123_g2404 [Phytophthora cactorum]|nr:hypothetical protein PC123_g2404 [Phytophthora cactorum]